MVGKATIHNAFLTIGVVAGYPHGIVSRKLQNPLHRKLFHLICGLALSYALYGPSFLIVFLGDLIVYLTLFLPNPFILVGTLIPIAEIFYIHYTRLNTIGDWTSDLSGLIMFSALRLIMTTFNVFDGRKELKRENWKKMALSSPPPIFDFFVYLFSYSGLYSGPIVPFSAFKEILEMKSTPEEVSNDIKAGLKPFLLSLLNGFFYAICIKVFPTKMILEDKFYERPCFLQVVIAILYSYFHTSRYRFAWLGGEASLACQGAQRVQTYDTQYCRSFRPEFYYTQRQLGGLVNEWNHSVHFFLKEFIHVRVLSIGGSNTVAKFCTYMFSAFWHGFYPGYYVYAMVVFSNAFVDSIRFKLFSPLLESTVGTKVATILDCVYTQSMNSYQGAGWDLLWLSPYFYFLKRTKFGPFLLEFALIAVGYTFRVLSPKKKIE
ncbi:MBOAT family protein [Trichomonas vaginalis G3]|uniref:MBOAT family protein n=1 Tax=Trichomonas vaginalis (strain ATCC PRA-98 / G3) TaxID=412133 RepID=A2G838_TRIV3|nr:protein octanoylation [Trichomonas vaginalis G3]EAX86679.1 MBOAT family protein [Trichomonas vaginalis G3]KAI5545504.1 protein octanoylation [Trichomonas vaginalis G3]|eukprot:XP_001299609.1 MBOAT family protein [Trichomonas vaginalis G3]